VFPGAKLGKPLSSMALLTLLRRMQRGELTVHGFRSTFRDCCAEATNYPREVAEATLARTLGDKTEATYKEPKLASDYATRLDEDFAIALSLASLKAKTPSRSEVSAWLVDVESQARKLLERLDMPTALVVYECMDGHEISRKDRLLAPRLLVWRMRAGRPCDAVGSSGHAHCCSSHDEIVRISSSTPSGNRPFGHRPAQHTDKRSLP
jgi:hypothetical protein